MTIIYRTAGDWGAGKGSNLEPAEVDGNFYDLDQRVGGLEDNPAVPASISDFVVTGNQMTISLSDGSTYGPFTLPVVQPNWRGEWVAGESYAAYDWFYIDGDGIYAVLRDYEAPTDFDPDVFDSEGELLQKLSPLVPGSKVTIETETTTNRTLSQDDAGKYIRLTSDSDTTVTCPANSDTAIDIGSIFTLREAGAGFVSVVGGAGVTINVPFGTQAQLRDSHSTATIIKVDTDEWDLNGDLLSDTTTSSASSAGGVG